MKTIAIHVPEDIYTAYQDHAAARETAGIALIASGNWRDIGTFPGIHPILAQA